MHMITLNHTQSTHTLGRTPLDEGYFVINSTKYFYSVFNCNENAYPFYCLK
jgi:hypothetical protein